MDCNCGGDKCNNQMWVDQYNQVMIWMCEHHLWEKYKFDTAEELKHYKETTK